MPEYNNTIRKGWASVKRLQEQMRLATSNAAKPFMAQWIRLATAAGEAQVAGIHKAIITRQYEALETICSCGVIAKGTPLDKTEGHLDHYLQVVGVIILEFKPERYVAVCTHCGAKQKTHKPLNQDDALVTSLRLRHRRGCVTSVYATNL